MQYSEQVPISDVFHQTPKPKVSRKGRKCVKLVPALNPVTYSIQLEMSLLNDEVVLSVKEPSKIGG